MKKLYLPLLFDGNAIEKPFGYVFITDALNAYTDLEQAKEFARKLAVSNSQNKVVILESILVVEPRRIEFSEKKYNDNGELIV